jgi:hypothetical protein
MARAEDQAYLLSVFNAEDDHLAYVHQDGLIMRHDKETFASDAIRSAAIGKLVGDYSRIFLFSYYAGYLDPGLQNIKSRFDPFTGCFISAMPATVVYLRFALKVLAFMIGGEEEKAIEMIEIAARQLPGVADFCRTQLPAVYSEEKEGWDLYYRILGTIQLKLKQDDAYALSLRHRAASIIQSARIHFE